MSVDLIPGIVRILTLEGETAGTGFVVSDDGLLATCAHVLEGSGIGPGSTVRVAFHVTGEEREARIEPDWWCGANAEDIAILRVDEPLPKEVEALLLGSSGGTSGHSFKTFGFPAAKDVEGMWGYGELGDPTTEAGQRVLQLTGTTEVTLGFSGAPVLDTTTRRVVGMVTSITAPDRYGRLTETAFITPTETLRAICPLLNLSDLCPYRGLAAFTEDDAEFFFGREELVADLVTRLRDSPRFLAVVGPSGSGKSSVVQAGLFPALRRGEVTGSRTWHVLTLRPGTNPLDALAGAGLDIDEGGDPRGTVRVFLGSHTEVERLVLFIDQFEELFALCSESVCERFLSHILALLESDLPLTVILALRADFYGYLLQHSSLVEWLKVGQVNVPPMEEKGLCAAVEGPAETVGLRFEAGLVESIVEEASQVKQPLPLLEATLTQLWIQREEGELTHAAYQAVGQVAGAISQWAEDTYSGLSNNEQILARRVFTRLLHYSEGEAADTRQRRSLAELAAHPEEEKSVHRLIQRLADARLLVTGRDPHTGEETAEIIHDALLWEWGRLRLWVTEQREFYLWRQRLDERLREWREKGQDEGALLRGALLAEAERWLAERSDDLNPEERDYIQESVALREQEQAARERRRQRVFLGLMVGLIIAIGLALVAWWQRNVALDAETAAVAEANLRATAEANALAEASVRATAEADALAAQAIAEAQRQEAEEQRQKALARQLAAQAEVLWEQDQTLLPRSVLLAVESVQRYPTWEGNQALLHGLISLPRTIAEMSHEREWVYAVAFSPDGHFVVSGSSDGVARVWEVATGQEVARMEHGAWINTVAYSPDGLWVASGGNDGTVRVWEAATGREVTRMEHTSSVNDVAFSRDGQWIASGYGTILEGGGVTVWNAATGHKIADMEHESRVEAVAFGPDGRQVAAASFDGTARVWDVAEEREVDRMEHEGPVVDVAFSPNGQWIATASWDGTARVWDSATGREVSRTTGSRGMNAVAFSPDGQQVVSGNDDHTVQVWEAATGQEVSRMTTKRMVLAVAFSPNGKWVAASEGVSELITAVSFVHVWDVDTGQELSFVMHMNSVRALAFSPDGKRIVSGDRLGTMQVWEVVTGPVARMIHEGAVNKVVFSPDGSWIATASNDNTARVWEAATGLEVSGVVHEDKVHTVAFSPDGRLVVSGSSDGTARVWEAATGREIARMVHEEGVELVAFCPDGQLIATAISRGGSVRVWVAETGQEVTRIEYPGDYVHYIVFSPDGQWLATSGSDPTVWVWDVETGQEVARMTKEGWQGGGDVAFSLDGQWMITGGASRVWETATGLEVTNILHRSRVGTGWSWENVGPVAFSPDEQYVATGAVCPSVEPCLATARVWEITTGREISRMEHDDSVRNLAFSPDGHYLMTSSREAVYVWDASTGQEITRMTFEDMVLDAAFSPDGRWIAAASSDGTAWVWWWRPNDLINEACSRLTRNLTFEEWQQYIGDEPYQVTCSNLPIHYSFTGEVWRAIEEGELESLIEAYVEAQLPGPRTAEGSACYWNYFCWFGSLQGYAVNVMSACEQAVALAPENGGIRDSRGLARALTDNTEGAIEDFQAFIDWTDDEEAKAQRQHWIESLSAGEDPFTPDELERLGVHPKSCTDSACVYCDALDRPRRHLEHNTYRN